MFCFKSSVEFKDKQYQTKSPPNTVFPNRNVAFQTGWNALWQIPATTWQHRVIILAGFHVVLIMTKNPKRLSFSTQFWCAMANMFMKELLGLNIQILTDSMRQ